MSMEDIMKALMESATAPQPQQQSAGGDAMSQMLGGLMGGSQQGSAGGDLISQVVGGLLGGGQQGGSAGGIGQLLGGLQQIIGGAPGTGQPLPTGGGNVNLGSNDPLMTLLQPIVNKVAAKAGISPQIATIIASIALHYLLQSSPKAPGASPLNLGNVMQSLASGRGVDASTLQQSGMVNDVMQSTGLDQQQAVKSLNATFNVLGGQVKGVKGKATLKRARRNK